MPGSFESIRSSTMICPIHRHFLTAFAFLLLLRFIFASECNEHSSTSNMILFATKVQESPIILIGTSLNKSPDRLVRNLFNVTFLVECILKGRPTQRIIHIVQAGSLLGRRSCQQLNVNRKYIVFLEPFFDETYRPVDFEEVSYSNPINVVLEKTCGLSRTFPFTEPNDTEAMMSNRCPPAVSVDCSIETSKNPIASIVTMATTPKPPAGTTRSTTTTTTTTTMTMNLNMFDPANIDLAVLSQLLAQHKNPNLTLAFLESQNHKNLFSDDDLRKNGVNRLSNSLILIFFISFLLF